MDCQPLVPGTEIRGGAEHVGADEHAAVGPPERDLLPGTGVLGGDAGERTERALREEVVADAEPSGESRAGAVVPAEQLNHARRRSRRLRSEEHTSELQSPYDLVCRLLLEKKKDNAAPVAEAVWVLMIVAVLVAAGLVDI